MESHTLNFKLSAKVNRIENINLISIYKPEYRNGKYCVNYSLQYPGDDKIYANYAEFIIGERKTVTLHDGTEIELCFPMDSIQEGFYQCTITI